MWTIVHEGPPLFRREPEVDTRSGRVRHYPHAKTEEGFALWRWRWIAAGRPRVDGPYRLTLLVEMRRPKTHFKKDGTLSAAGQRQPFPECKPDTDNVVKLCMDALKGHAFGDDAKCQFHSCEKVWSSRERTTAVCVSATASQRELSRDEPEASPALAA